ncbi:hypothetical protein K445DRAFT_304717 [Daldinia sp. EC12]|nr:hypothetical protein K445DRAFT_304717 [Daldinia sp. EC12]
MHLLLLVFLFSATVLSLPSKPALYHPKPKKLPSSSSSSKSKPDDQQQQQHDQHPKYFHEAGGTLELGHYDARFFRGEVPYAEHGPALRRLIRSWLATTRELGVDTWLAHGTLLGWWWNGRVMPWDYDLDVQMPTATLTYLGRYFNRTLHDYRFLDGEQGQGQRNLYINKTYLLDVNPYHTDLTRGNGANVIDARWIDVDTGLFVDITGLAERDAAGAPGVWSCKNAHKYRTRDIYPLRRTEFEGVPALVPFAFDKILTDEYGAKSLVNTEWAGHRWVPELKKWIKNPETPSSGKEKGVGKTVTKQQQQQQQQQDGKAVVVVVEKTVVKGAQ